MAAIKSFISLSGKVRNNCSPKLCGASMTIRAELKEAINLLGEYKGNKEEVGEKVNNVINRITEMIYKEEKILLLMALEHLTEDEWLHRRSK